MKLFRMLMAAVLVLAFFVGMAQAQELKSYRVDAFINPDDTVKSVVSLEFDRPVTSLEYRLGMAISNLNVVSGYENTQCSASLVGDVSVVTCEFSGSATSNEIKLNFDSKTEVALLEKNKRIITLDYSIGTQASKRVVAIRLPEGAILSEETASRSFIPSFGEVFTDGRKIGIQWRLDNPEEPTSFLISYILPEQQSFVLPFEIVGASAAVLVIAIIVVFLYFRRSMATEKAQVLRTVLNQDEKRIVDVLTANDGKAYQKSIVRETDFSKAKVSRLVKGLKARGVVDVEPVSGRENRIVLKGEKKNGEEKKDAGQPLQEDSGGKDKDSV